MTDTNSITQISYREAGEAVLDRLREIGRVFGPSETEKGSQYRACCPLHGDEHQSLSLLISDTDGVYFNCHKRCEEQKMLFAKIAEWVGLPKSAFGSGYSSTVTAAELAEVKGLSFEYLASLDITDSPMGARISYYTERLAAARTRVRRGLKGTSSYWCPYEESRVIVPYGLWHLPMWRAGRTLYFVEGESDCWVGWHYALPVLGFPGKGTPENLLRRNPTILDGIERIFVVEETDDYESKVFEASVRRGLTRAGYPGRVYTMRLPTKDLADLHTQRRETFMKDFNQARDTALDLAEWPEVATIPASSSAAKLYGVVTTFKADVISAFEARRRMAGLNSAQVKEALDSLEGAGVLRKLPQDRKRGRPSYQYRINPKVKAA